MKCIKKDGKVMKVPEEIAAERVTQGWKYCPKSEYKGSTNKESVEKAVAVKILGPKIKRKRPNKETGNDTDKPTT